MPEELVVALPGRPVPVLGRGERLVTWSAEDLASTHDVRRVWDLAAVGRLLDGLRRTDPAAVWAAAHGLPAPPRVQDQPDLLAAAEDPSHPTSDDGQLNPAWLRERSADEPDRSASLALEVQRLQEERLRGLPDLRTDPVVAPLPVLTAWSESAAALLAVELGATGLPLDRAVAAAYLEEHVGPRPRDEAEARRQREERDAPVHARFPGPAVDLRSPAQVKELLGRVGLDLPDTRSWRLEAHAGAVPAVAALLAWRKAERLSTTNGWAWLDGQVTPAGRLHGSWGAADAAAGRMTVSAGLHSLPAELRHAVRAEPGHLLVRADLGQVEPRVLAAVSHDPGLVAATRQPDLYAPVAAALGCDRPTAKVAVLAAMYGQTSGTAGAALRRMERAYPRAMAYLRTAEEAGRTGQPLRTCGGRLVHAVPPVGQEAAYGRFTRNAAVQGAAAELFKAWAVTVRDRLLGTGAEIVLCLHDELLLHVPEDSAPDAVQLLHDALASVGSWWAAGSGVGFRTEVGVGASWADARTG
ncbi:DNA polymerase-1 [Motilibacter rhizosphaerae]|uniref:DNA-directed DNA polymerase n=1 Tax=Motilibacter rhizosphaerae TaxID=598652 RepID=A0A4Q7NFW4_9ACTN|nr:DNA polymerase [Motilibacter rhizosphaerae]RZS82692.1 DNA polymerase-1 [Motilibacter rhizosphaerae]